MNLIAALAGLADALRREGYPGISIRVEIPYWSWPAFVAAIKRVYPDDCLTPPAMLHVRLLGETKIQIRRGLTFDFERGPEESSTTSGKPGALSLAKTETDLDPNAPARP